MNDIFQKRVRAAAVAGWWTLLIAAIFLTIQWIAYLFIMNARPDWVCDMWGPNLDWPFVQGVWFWMTAIFKLFVWMMAIIVIWLSLWARRLKKHTGGP
jgi:hypothetical protein